VLQWLVGADLDNYSLAKPLSVEELKPIVKDVSAGLRVLHRKGICHRDLKPGNIFLRLDFVDPLEKFDATRHRDPKKTPLLSAVVIDFGVARRFTNETGEQDRTVEGTLGFIAPEQAKGNPVLLGRTDLYALAGTIYNAITGERFFEDMPTAEAYLVAHAAREPLQDPVTCRRLPDKLVPLLREATRLDPMSRPDLETFATKFLAL